MIKFVVLLTSAITFNFTMSFGELLGITQNEKPQEIQLVFSESPVGVESGQPVYPISTKVYVKSLGEKEFTISVNGGEELKQRALEVEISNFIQAQADTYTVVVDAKSDEYTEQEIFGFTTK